MPTLADVCNSIKDSIIAVSSDGIVQFMNGAASTIFGSKHPFTRLIEQLPAPARAALHSVLVGALPDYHLTYRFQKEGSQSCWLRMTITPLQCSSGVVIQHHEITLNQYRHSTDGRQHVPFLSDRITPEEARQDTGAAFEKFDPQHHDDLTSFMSNSALAQSSLQQEFRLLPDHEVHSLKSVSCLQKLAYGSHLWREEQNKAQADLETQLLEHTQRLSKVDKQLILLNKKVRREIMKRKKLEKKLKESNVTLSLLAAELNLSEEHERRRIAMALHDEVVQDLILSKLRLDLTLRDGTAPPDVLKSLVDLIDKSIQQIRDICHELGPPLDLELTQAICSLGERLARQHGLHFSIQGDLKAVRLPNHMRIVLYQAVRELLVNVVKHAKANRITVQIRYKLDIIQLLVMDDGVGFSNPDTKGFGLYHLKQRIDSLNGTVRVISTPGEETVVRLVVPLTPFEA